MLLKVFILAIAITGIVCDTCDTYVHPTYGKGSCVDKSTCTGVYVDNYCESKPAGIKCCFKSSAPITCSSTKLTHTQAKNYLAPYSITTSSSGGCTNQAVATCTSLDNVNCKSICAIIRYKQESGCAVTITGGTEVGHASGTYSHYNGYKIDMSVSSCHTNYITKKYTYIGKRGDGADQYQDPRGNIFALEGNHWDNTFYNC